MDEKERMTKRLKKLEKIKSSWFVRVLKVFFVLLLCGSLCTIFVLIISEKAPFSEQQKTVEDVQKYVSAYELIKKMADNIAENPSLETVIEESTKLGYPNYLDTMLLLHTYYLYPNINIEGVNIVCKDAVESLCNIKNFDRKKNLYDQYKAHEDISIPFLEIQKQGTFLVTMDELKNIYYPNYLKDKSTFGELYAKVYGDNKYKKLDFKSMIPAYIILILSFIAIYFIVIFILRVIFTYVFTGKLFPPSLEELTKKPEPITKPLKSKEPPLKEKE